MKAAPVLHWGFGDGTHKQLVIDEVPVIVVSNIITTVSSVI